MALNLRQAVINGLMLKSMHQQGERLVNMKTIKAILKCVLAGVVAVAILCVVFTFYVFTPIHTANINANTDYVWPANARWFKMTEGISWGKFDSNGYNNLEVIEAPDILLLGSSHMEGVDVQQDETVASLLNQIFAGEYSAYSLGISGHSFIKTCKYLPATLALYSESPEFVVIETSNIAFQPTDIDALLDETVEYTNSYDTGVIAVLQRLPFLRLLYHQISHGMVDIFMPGRNLETVTSAEDSLCPNEQSYGALFEYIAQSMKSSRAKLIILYHPTEWLQEDGSVSFLTNETYIDLFSRKCDEYGIIFIDMTQPFIDMYNTTHQLPHGFITGEIGVGHLNASGHKVIAQVLADKIVQLRKENGLCK